MRKRARRKEREEERKSVKKREREGGWNASKSEITIASMKTRATNDVVQLIRQKVSVVETFDRDRSNICRFFNS